MSASRRSANEEVVALFQKAQVGDERALSELIDKLGPDLVQIFRLKRHQRVHSIYDSDDFLQDLRIALFHAGVDTDKFGSCEAFIAYCKKAAANKVKEVNRHFFVTKRLDLGREVPLGDRDPEQPEPSEENVKRVVKTIDPQMKKLVIAICRGDSPEEISGRLGIPLEQARFFVELANRKGWVRTSKRRQGSD